MAKLGMDTDSGKQLQQQMSAEAGRMRTSIGSIGKLATSVVWDGPDANRFKTQEWPGFAKQVEGIALGLENLAKNLAKQISEQEAASNS